MAERVDLVVIGGGLAGLSLALRLARAGYAGQLRVVEPREAYLDDRSWAFWTPDGSALPVPACRHWDRWRFSRRDGARVVQSAPGWRYVYVRSLDVYQAAQGAIAAMPNAKLMCGVRAGAIDRVADRFTVETSAGALSARHVVDTRPPSATQWAGTPMFQSFAGREIALAQPGLDDGEVELMTDMRADAHGFVFSYVLPLSPTRALVEATRFSAQPLGAGVLAADLGALLSARGWSQAEVIRSEAARLPMGLPRAGEDAGPAGVVRAGMAAGALRAASGYGFQRIQAWAERCANAVMAGGAPVGHPAEPRLRAWMDRVFLQALVTAPARTPDFFMGLASTVPGPAFVRFMSDRAGWGDHARVIAGLPPGPFLRAMRHGAARAAA